MNPIGEGPPTIQTRARHKVAALVIILGVITYVDRACISTLTPTIMSRFSLTKVQMGYVFSAFALAYASFGIPAAWILDRKRVRFVLTRMVVWWSVFMVATGAAMGFTSLLLSRFMFGVGEAGAWPAMALTFSRWIPRSERGRVQGAFFAASHFAGGITPFLVTILLPYMSWRAIFAFFGVFGFAWAATWRTWFRDEPSEHPGVNAAELAHIAPGDENRIRRQTGWAFWRSLLRSRSLIALCVIYFPNSFVFYFCITWLPTYLSEQYGLTLKTLSFFAGLPLILSLFGDLFGGFTTDRMTAKFGLRIGRCGVGGVAYLVAGISISLAPVFHQAIPAACLIALATAAGNFALAPAWATCIELGQENAAVVSAAMNTSGQIGSLICPLVVAYALKWYSSWDISLHIMGALYLIGVVAWFAIRPRDRILRTGETQSLA
jgi:ACS family glucarate transporter-like MFS transporter